MNAADLWPPAPGWADAALLTALLVATHRNRSPRLALALPWVAVGWFGFFRGGCPCPLGTLGELPGGAVAPLAAVSFLLPLAFAQLHGRTYCGGACPIGAFQDLFGFRARRQRSKLSEKAERRLGALRWVALAGVLGAAALGAANPVCAVDPFPALYAGRFTLAAAGTLIGLAALSAVVSRPFCRWLCPYAPLLESGARVAPGALIVAPACVRCGKCDKVCPMNAIRRGACDPGACIRCGRCAAVCPKHAVRAGTP